MAPTECLPSACLLACLPFCLLACLFAFLLAYLLAFLLACQLACLLACLLTCLLACLSSLEVIFNVILNKVTHTRHHDILGSCRSQKPVISVQSPHINSLEELDQKVEESFSTNSNGYLSCHYCEKLFKKPAHAREHVEIHFEGLSFPCTFCGKNLRLKITLRVRIDLNE